MMCHDIKVHGGSHVPYCILDVHSARRKVEFMTGFFLDLGLEGGQMDCGEEDVGCHYRHPLSCTKQN